MLHTYRRHSTQYSSAFSIGKNHNISQHLKAASGYNILEHLPAANATISLSTYRRHRPQHSCTLNGGKGRNIPRHLPAAQATIFLSAPQVSTVAVSETTVTLQSVEKIQNCCCCI
jgi:hypothetical protein